jgi:cytochrome c oxidase subunit 3
MTIMLVLVAALGAVAAWWLSQQRLTEKPWLENGPATSLRDPGSNRMPAASVGLGVFLAVVSSLFALFASAYSMRMHMASDWQSLPVPWLLWPNTGMLILSSAALGWAQVAARQKQIKGIRLGLLLGSASAILFLVGQLVAWDQLASAGFYLAANPANAFFYLLTALHGLHLLGGLVALGRIRVRGGGARSAIGHVAPGLNLCAFYWHFLLLVWLGVFVLLLHG